MRPAHILKGNKKGEHPRQWLFLDTETRVVEKTTRYTEIELQLWIGCYTQENKKRTAWVDAWEKGVDCESLYQGVIRHTRSRTALTVVGSNIFFDLRVSHLLRRLITEGWKLKRSYTKGMVFIMDLRLGDRTIRFRNLQNWVRGSIESLGAMIGKPKLECNPETATPELLEEYCRRDVEILRDTVLLRLKFLQENDLGNYQSTSAGQAFTAYRHRFMKGKIYIHNHEEALLLERSAYFGGRCEPFFIGIPPGEEFHSLDVNSMYPHVMKSNQYPGRLWFYTSTMELKQLSDLVAEYCVVADVTLRTETPRYPIYHANGLCFPVGTFRTSLNTESLRVALETQSVTAIHRVAVYYKGSLFKAWVTALWALRKEFQAAGNIPFQTMTKDLMNTLYGKWAQRADEVYDEQEEAEPGWGSFRTYYPALRKWELRYKMGDRSYCVKKGKGESYNSFPTISAHVTDYARNYLWGLIVQAGRDRVFYCDTDSLIVDREGFNRLAPRIDPTELGELKHENTSGQLVIRAPKDYVFGGKSVIKGVRPNAVSLLHNSYSQEVFPGFLSEMGRGLMGNYRIMSGVKVLNRTIKRGTVTPSGWVLPLRLGE